MQTILIIKKSSAYTCCRYGIKSWEREREREREREQERERERKREREQERERKREKESKPVSVNLFIIDEEIIYLGLLLIYTGTCLTRFSANLGFDIDSLRISEGFKLQKELPFSVKCCKKIY